MSNNFSALKNIAWAIAIILCLLALLVGLIFSMTRGYFGVTERPGVELGEGGVSAGSGDSGVDNMTYAVGSGSLLTVPESEDGGQDYLNKLTFLCDSTLVGLRDYGLLAGGTETTQVWATHAGSLPFGTVNEAKIEYPADGSEQTIVDAVTLAQPEILVIALGSDSLAQLDQTTFLTAYRTLVRNITSASPNTTLICCGTCSVIANYTGSDGLSPTMMSDANEWIKTVCIETGAYYADISYPLGDGSGTMFSSYASSNGKSLNSTGIGLVLDYLKTHAIE